MIFCIVCVQYLYFILQIGAQFERENEEDLKDQMDFMQLIEAMPGLRKCVCPFLSKLEVCV